MEKRLDRRAGVITVFLSLMLIIMISFLLSLVKYALIQLGRDQAYVVSEMAIESVMGEYNIEAQEEFDLFLLDGSYGKGNFSESEILSHYKEYIEYETDMGKDIWSFNAKALDWGCELSDALITGIELATDNNGKAIITQLANYMEDVYGISYLKELTDKFSDSISGQVKDKQNSSTLLGNILSGALTDMSGACDEENRKNIEKEEQKIIGPGQAQAEAMKSMTVRQSGSGLENWVKNLMGKAAYSLVVKNKDNVSKKETDTGSLFSTRKRSGNIRKGYGNVPAPPARHKLPENTLFKAYLYTHLNTYSEGSSEKLPLDYEIEYLLGGMGSDKENLGISAEHLLLLRSGINLVFLLTDPNMRKGLDTAVKTICAAIPVPGISILAESILLVMWAVTESVVELRDLFDNGRMEVIKTRENWRTSPDKLPDLIIDFLTGKRSDITGTVSETADAAGNGRKNNKGLTYKEWLMVLLSLENSEKACSRYMDLVEASIHKSQGNSAFKMDNCVVGMTVNNIWRISGGGEYSFDISYGYR